MALPSACVRRHVAQPDGTTAVQLHVLDGAPGAAAAAAPPPRRVFQLVRTLRAALMGKVKAAVECELDPATGAWAAPAAAGAQRVFAVKQLYRWCIARRCTKDGHPVREDPANEIAVMGLLASPGHPNVLRLEALLADEHCVYLVLEHCGGGELMDQVALLGSVHEDAAREYVWQLVCALRYMHAKGVAHRDVSLENAMLTAGHHAAGHSGGGGGGGAAAAHGGGGRTHDGDDGDATMSAARCEPAAATAADERSSGGQQQQQVKLIDFGLSVRLPPSGDWLLLPENRVGKDRYMPPEIHAMLPYSGQAADAWSLGMVAWYLLTGRELYARADPLHCRVFHCIATGRLREIVRAWGLAGSHVSDDAMDLVDALLQVDPWRRASLAQAAGHAWFAKAGFGVGGSPPAAATAAAALLPLQPCVNVVELTRIGCARAEGACGGLVVVGGGQPPPVLQPPVQSLLQQPAPPPQQQQQCGANEGPARAQPSLPAGALQ